MMQSESANQGIHAERGTTAIEFALVALALLSLVFGGIEYARMLWTWQALQLAGDQVARCVAVASTTPNSGCQSSQQTTYAINTATGLGAGGLRSTGVRISNPSTGSPCNPPAGNSAVAVTLTLNFTSPASTLIPGLSRTLTTVSCYSLTGQ